MRPPIVERRRLPRRPVLEDLTQGAIDSVLHRGVDEALHALSKAVPADMHQRALSALSDRLDSLLGIARDAA